MKGLVWLLSLFLTTIAVLDPLYCADGCASRDVGVTSQAQAKADCPLCQPSIVIQPALPVSFAVVQATSVHCDRVSPPAFHLTLEHPPRVA
jgi:hypothetical protein